MTLPSRRLSNLVLAAVVLSVAASSLALAQDQAAPTSPGPVAPAQQGTADPTTPQVIVHPQILVVDEDRLFTQSKFGMRVAAEIEKRSTALGGENRRIEAELTSEEQALTDARASLPDAEFRKRADAFDEKVQKIRAEQDAKSRDLASFRDTEQQRFVGQLGQILADIARTRGALAVIDRRALLVSADAIDITEEAIAQVDARLGDGAQK